MIKIGKTLFGAALCLVLVSGLMANGLNLSGVGAKSAAMGGAFIGLANDPSAVFWNPAGLTQITKPTLYVYETDLMPSGTYVNSSYGVDARTKKRIYPSGAIAFIDPLNDRLTVGLDAYIPSGIATAWNGDQLTYFSSGTAVSWRSQFLLATAGPFVAFKVTDTFSLGATFNVNYGYLAMDRVVLGQYSDKLHGWAVGATFGALYKPVDWFSVGATYRTSSHMTIKGTASMPALAGVMATESGAQHSYIWPAWMGAGIAVKPFRKLTLTADAQYTNWDKIQYVPMMFSDATWQSYWSPYLALSLNWENKIQWRFGTEYAFNSTWSVRAGYYFDPSPSPAETLNILLPEMTYNAATFGLGYNAGRFTVDLGCEYLKGTAATAPAGSVGMAGTHNMNILAPNIALTYHF